MHYGGFEALGTTQFDSVQSTVHVHVENSVSN